jgi:serine/threonine protein kinase
MRTFKKGERYSKKKSRKIKKQQMGGSNIEPPYLFFKNDIQESLKDMFTNIFTNLKLTFEETSSDKRIKIKYTESDNLNENIEITDCPTVNEQRLGKVTNNKTCAYGGFSTVFNTNDGKIVKITENIPDELNGLKIHKKLNQLPPISVDSNSWNVLIPLPQNNNNFISEIYSYGNIVDTNYLFSTMKQYKTDLEEYFKKNRTLYIKLLGICVQIIYGLKIIHDNKILYRDLKPENIVVNTEGEGEGSIPSIAFIDFGLSLDLETYGERGKAAAGSGKYAAPEAKKEGNYSYEVDIYSFAKVIENLDLSFINQYNESNVIEYCLKQREINKRVYRPDAHEVLYGGAYITHTNKGTPTSHDYDNKKIKYSIDRYLQFLHDVGLKHFISISTSKFIYFDGNKIIVSDTEPADYTEIFITSDVYNGLLDIFEYYQAEGNTKIQEHIEQEKQSVRQREGKVVDNIGKDLPDPPEKVPKVREVTESNNIKRIYDTKGKLYDALDEEMADLVELSNDNSKTWQEVLTRVIHNETYELSIVDRNTKLDEWKTEVGELGEPAKKIIENSKKNGGFFAIRQ